ncbi:hypothetical protein CONPUDRAFT_138698 [Coniophora puteana RWD-64-598 SS2]|uniref:Uncharacterized protein n=1 Tax=Coniophora puteana (strain RWD-64-598) TaxID=741705 RepID=A0A5M3MID0_CONPW|nr:uncharacterized protein CONPUDRAFT_138698 [Coniophora puteana RWD-64-598 SS2]EIW78405.1 hypothetical protein CONPUDRAFT_138698 [Coniophora puteana RWD-64-598 SS2]
MTSVSESQHQEELLSLDEWLTCKLLGKDLHPELQAALFESEGLNQITPTFDLLPLHPLVDPERKATSLKEFLLTACHHPQSTSPSDRGSQQRNKLVTFNRGFTQQLKGNAVAQFISNLHIYHRLYDRFKYYGRTIAIVQSSGTGKSRLMREVANQIPSVTITFRSPMYYNNVSEGWPPPDQPVQEFLLNNYPNVRAEVVAAALLGAMFEFFGNCIKNFDKSQPLQLSWLSPFVIVDPSNPKSSTRHRSFCDIRAQAEKLLNINSANLAYEDAYDDQDALIAWYGRVYSVLCHKAAKALAITLKGTQHNFLVIGFDECSFLEKGGDASSGPTAMSIIALQRVIEAADDYSVGDLTIWYTFIDTSSSVFELVPRREKAPSFCLGGLLDPLMPYPFTGFDQCAPSDLSRTPRDGLNLERLRRYGRPLWSTEIVKTVVELAYQKLFCSTQFTSNNVNDVFAAFSQRVGLDLTHSAESNRIAIEAVRSHMRMLFAVVDRTYIETRVPSEPILALAAAQALRPSESLKTAINTLFQKLLLQGHIMDRGVQGELYARILLTLARDAATQACNVGPDKNYFVVVNDAMHFVATITLAGLLTELHGDKKEDPTYKNLLQMAQKKHVNFTHFVHLNQMIGNFSAEYLHYLWDRQCAIQCAHNQPVVDIIIPTYSGSLDDPWDDAKVGTFSVQVKLKGARVQPSVVESLVGPRIEGRRPDNEVVMLMELGLKPSAQVRKPMAAYYQTTATVPNSTWKGYERPETKPRWCIHIRGHSADEYPVVGEHQALQQVFEHVCPWPIEEFQDDGDAFEALLSTSITPNGQPIVMDLDT